MSCGRKRAAHILGLLLLVTGGQGLVTDSCGRRTIVVNVRDHNGTPLDQLPAASFRATPGNQPVRVLSDRVRTSSPRVVLLLDHSGSVNQSNHSWDVSRFVAGHSIVSGVSTRIALVTFSDHIIDTVDFGHPLNDSLQRLVNLEDGKGRTALYDSLTYAASLFQPPQLGDAIYIVTDGADNRSKSHGKDVERVLTSNGIRLFWFILSDELFPTEEERNGHQQLRWLVEAGGGSAVSADDVNSPKERHHFYNVAGHLYDSMKTFHELEVEVPRGTDESHSWDLQLVDGRGRKRKDVEISYPRRLPVCAMAAPQ